MTIKEIAELAGVSVSTVSKIVNNKDISVSPVTREHVLKIVKEYNYSPYGDRLSGAQNKSFMLGVLAKSIRHFGSVLNGIVEEARKHGYTVLVYDSGDSVEVELKNITSLINNNVDGILWEPVCEESVRRETAFKQREIPYCFLNTAYSSEAFNIDFEQMGFDLTEKLINLNHTHLSCMVRKNSVSSELVWRGFKRCLFEYGIPYSEDLILNVERSDFLADIMINQTTAVLCSHYEDAMVLQSEMQKSHYRIPADISVVSLRTERRASVVSTISCAEIPYREFGGYVCEHLIDVCEKKTSRKNQIYLVDSRLDSMVSVREPYTERMPKIVVVGSLNIDITLNSDQFPSVGNTIVINSSSVLPGGKGLNQAVGVAKLGREVSLIGKLGSDYEASILYDTLKRENVDVSGVKYDGEEQTGKAYIYLQKNGESSISVLPGANHQTTPEYLRNQEFLFKRCGYCLVSTEIPVNTVLETMKLAHKYGAQNILKPVIYHEIPEELYRYTDIIVPNQKEAELLCGSMLKIEEQAEFLLRKGVKCVIITLGHEGCYLRTQEEGRYFPSADFPAVDTTGGADAFISALASYLVNGYSMQKAIKIAAYAAGFCISRQGTASALIDRSSLENYIKLKEPQLLEFI